MRKLICCLIAVLLICGCATPIATQNLYNAMTLKTDLKNRDQKYITDLFGTPQGATSRYIMNQLAETWTYHVYDCWSGMERGTVVLEFRDGLVTEVTYF